ncbi:MAG: amidohydrolase family protein [Myxococcota bacterium]
MNKKAALPELGFQAFDADNHYYEHEDAFIRHIDPRMKKRAMDWAEVRGRKNLLVGGQINRFIPNPTFDPVAKPGCLDEYFRGRNPEGKNIREIFGDLEPINPAYRDRDARLALMESQNLGGCFMFPTLGVGMEEALRDDLPAMLAAFRAFNRWMEEDWGFAYQEKIFAAPYMVLTDLDWALEELEWCIEHDVRTLVMRAAPVLVKGGTNSPADPMYDPFWARVAEAGISVAYHSGDAGYNKYSEQWGSSDEFQAFDFQAKRLCMSANPILDLCATLVCDGLFDRHPGLRIATIETGSSWVPILFAKFKKVYGQLPFAFKEDPRETFRKHFWISPYYEDDISELRDLIGADRILFGSDYPHGEGLAEPTEFVNDLPDFSEEEVRQIMRDNGISLVQRQPA